MNYCKKCFKIFEEEADFCPSCGEPFPKAESTGSDLSRRMAELDSAIESRKAAEIPISQPNVTPAPPYAPTEPAPYAPTPSPYTSTPTPPPFNPSAPPYQHMPPYYPASPETPVVGTAKRVILTLLSVFFAPVGVIAGIVFLSAKTREERVFGQTLLTIGVAEFLMVALLCCGIILFAQNASYMLYDMFGAFY